MSRLNDKEKINDLLTRGVGEFIDPDGSFRKKLENSPEKIVIKFGVDPTRPDIHLGHAVVFHKLRQFQDMGCKIVFLIGDYTAEIGDPTGKSKERPPISFEEIIFNANTYKNQVSTILDTSKDRYQILSNSIWYRSATDYPGSNMIEKAKLWEKDREFIKNIRSDHAAPTVTLLNFIFAIKNITHAQLIERDMFQKRIKSGGQLHMHEMLYPVLQGIDSHAIAGFFGTCDLEVGGTDQTFNMLMGRPIMKANNQAPQAVLAFKLLEGIDGKEKMSKSLDNYIGITDEPNNMYGKTMSIPDSSIINYFELCTFISMDEVDKIRTGIKDGSIHPKEAKMNLARQIVSIYHGDKKAQEAESHFVNTFQKGGTPKDVQIVPSPAPNISLIDYIIEAGLSKSKSEARRKIEQGGVELGGNKITDFEATLNSEVDEGKILKVGKKDFVKIQF